MEDQSTGRRAMAKQLTREKVLGAAKRLFMSRGYEAATIRDIAAEAGMSTGAVFANFTDKTDLFHAVLSADLEGHMAQIRGLAGHPGPIKTALGELFAIGYRIHMAQLPLLQAATSLSWTRGLEGVSGERPSATAVVAMVSDMLDRASARRELVPGADSRLIAEMLWDAYIANYRRALFDHWSTDQLNAHFSRPMDVILAGVTI